MRDGVAKAGVRAAIVSVWLVAPVALIVALTILSAQLSVTGEPRAAWVAAGEAGTETSRQVGVALDWRERGTITAPAWTGMVREVLLAPGDTVSSGTPVARVDGMLRIAWHSSAPFYRTLAPGDAGVDVRQLQKLLAARGLPHDSDGRYLTSTRKGVAALAVELGMPRADGSIFDPTWIVFLPGKSAIVDTILLSVGQPAPALGAEIITQASMLAAAHLVSPQQAAMAGSTDPLNDTTPPTEALVAEPGEILRIGDLEIPLHDDRSAITDEGIDLLRTLVARDRPGIVGRLIAQVETGDAGAVIEVPAVAVHTDPSGATCLRTRDDRDERTVPVTIVAGEGGRVIVTGAISPGDPVGVGAFGPEESCR